MNGMRPCCPCARMGCRPCGILSSSGLVMQNGVMNCCFHKFHSPIWMPVAALLVLLLAALPFAAFAAGPVETPAVPQKVVLQLPWKHQFQFAGFYAAEARGLYAEQGLDVELRERG